MIRTSRRAAAALAAASAAVLLASGPVSAATTASSARQARPATASRAVPASIPRAKQALARAQALLAAHPAAAARTAAPAAGSARSAPRAVASRDATMVLRDLAARLRQLHGADRAAAEALLARPSQNPDPDGIVSWGAGRSDLSTCSATLDLCVHWTPTGTHAPDAADTSPANGIPDYVDQTLAEAENVWTTEVDTLGYKAPLPDGTSGEHGPGDQLDVYLANIGGKGYYGYCTSDDPDLQKKITPATSAVSAYCVFDNDYAEPAFGAHTALDNLRVTAAHEFMHAVQFGYDFYEDRWLMESSAAWVEDVVYDAVNDNRQYLSTSPLASSSAPVDKGTRGFQYGSWIFLRYLSETYGDDVVRAIWARADDSPDEQTADDFKTYSVRAIDAVLRHHGSSLSRDLGDFAARNVAPSAFYEEGSRYPKVKSSTLHVSPAHPRTALLSTTLKHLASLPATIKPGAAVSRGARLRVVVDAPSGTASPEARVVVRYRDGRTQIRRASLDATGAGAVTVPFGRGQVASVVVVLANGSSRYGSCFTGSPWGGLSCWGGRPRDDGLRYAFQARLV